MPIYIKHVIIICIYPQFVQYYPFIIDHTSFVRTTLFLLNCKLGNRAIFGDAKVPRFANFYCTYVQVHVRLKVLKYKKCRLKPIIHGAAMAAPALTPLSANTIIFYTNIEHIFNLLLLLA